MRATASIIYLRTKFRVAAGEDPTQETRCYQSRPVQPTLVTCYRRERFPSFYNWMVFELLPLIWVCGASGGASEFHLDCSNRKIS